MKGKLARITAAVLALGLVSSSAAAQLATMPVSFSPQGGPGVTVGADFGFGLNDDAKYVTGQTPIAYGGHVRLGLPKFYVTVRAAQVNPRGPTGTTFADKEISFGGDLAVNILNAPLLPVALSIQGGVGYTKFGTGLSEQKVLDVPIGVGIAINVPNPAVNVEPWAAPRIHINRVEVGADTQTRTGFGVSAGLNLGLPMGLGFHVAADWVRLPRKTSGSLNLPEEKRLTAGLGVHYTFTVPSLGVPVVPGM